MITPAPGYRIHYTNGGIQYVGYSNTQRFTIQETLPRSYKVYVVATNTFGVSLPSRIVTVIPCCNLHRVRKFFIVEAVASSVGHLFYVNDFSKWNVIDLCFLAHERK